MNRNIGSITRFRFSCIGCSLLLFSFVASVCAQDVYLCVWRNPERTMTRIFPDAKDYKTMTVPISDQERAKIEKATGHELLPGQRESFQYFEMTGEGGKRIGTIIAASQKGEYGAIEFVVGLDTSNVVKGLYIQRSRERDQSFKNREFLDLFLGKEIKPLEKIKSAYTGESTPGTAAVVRGLTKEFAAYASLVGK